jgi:hypothetical protein
MVIFIFFVVSDYIFNILVSPELDGERIWQNMMKYHQLNDYLI